MIRDRSTVIGMTALVEWRFVGLCLYDDGPESPFLGFMDDDFA